jgi:hypothetical protein
MVVTVVLVGADSPRAGDDGTPDAAGACAGEEDAVAVAGAPAGSAAVFCSRERLIKCCRKRSWDAAGAGVVSAVAGVPGDSAAALMAPQIPTRLRLRINRLRNSLCSSRHHWRRHLLAPIRCMPCSSPVSTPTHHPYLELLYPFHGTDDICDPDTKFVIDDDHFPSCNELLIYQHLKWFANLFTEFDD